MVNNLIYLVLVFLLGCREANVYQSIELTVKSEKFGALPEAKIYIDQVEVGQTSSKGTWHGRILLKEESNHTIKVLADQKTSYFSTWEHQFLAKNQSLTLVADLYDAPKSQHSNLASEDYELEKKIIEEKFLKEPFDLWRKSYSAQTGGLPPLLPWKNRDTLQSLASAKIKESSNLSKINSEAETSVTLYLHEGEIPLVGASVWFGMQKPELVCQSNIRGRCTIVINKSINQILVKKEGYKSLILNSLGEGAYHLKMERGKTHDIFIDSVSDSWKLTAKGIEVARGTGSMFIVADASIDSLNIECQAKCSRKSEPILFTNEPIKIVKPKFKSDLKPIEIEKIRFVGVFEGSLQKELDIIKSELPEAVKNIGYRKAEPFESKYPTSVVSILKNKDDFSIEVLFMSPEGNLTGAAINSCDQDALGCLGSTFSQASQIHKPSPGKKSIKIVDLSEAPIENARVYQNARFIGKTGRNGTVLMAPLSGTTLEIVAEGKSFFRKYYSSELELETVKLEPGSALLVGQNIDQPLSIYRGGEFIGKVPGFFAIKPGQLDLDLGEKYKSVTVEVHSGMTSDLSEVSFHINYMNVWKNQVIAGDFIGAEKTLNDIDRSHPDWALAQYLIGEKHYVETGELTDSISEIALLGLSPARWIWAKVKAKTILSEPLVLADAQNLVNATADVLLFAGSSKAQEFFTDLLFYRSMVQLEIAIHNKNSLDVQTMLRVANSWLETGKGELDQGLGRKVWEQARTESSNLVRGM